MAFLNISTFMMCRFQHPEFLKFPRLRNLTSEISMEEMVKRMAWETLLKKAEKNVLAFRNVSPLGPCLRWKFFSVPRVLRKAQLQRSWLMLLGQDMLTKQAVVKDREGSNKKLPGRKITSLLYYLQHKSRATGDNISTHHLLIIFLLLKKHLYDLHLKKYYRSGSG